MTTEVNYEPPTDEQTASREDLQSRDLEDEKDQHGANAAAGRIQALAVPCYHPLNAHQVAPGAQPTFPKTGPWNMKLPCGRCIGCRLDRSKQWAIRLMHEAQQHNKNSFITLTLNEQTLASRREEREPRFPVPLLSEKSAGSENSATSSNREEDEPAQQDSLVKRDLQLFVKKLRKSQDKDGLAKVKYYAVGEYGENYGRPHYHAALFGEDFSDDRYVWRTTESGHTVYRSPRLEKLWTLGNCEIGELTFESAAYVARYIMKKINGPMAKEHYKRYDPTTGEIYWITPEFNLMSRGGRKGKGIAATWLETYKDDVYPHDYVIMNGQKLKPPRYYDNQLAASDQIGAILMKLEREFSARSQEADNTPKRLAAKEKVAQAKLNLGKRKLK